MARARRPHRQAVRKPTPEQLEAIKKVWVSYKKKATEPLRNQLMEFYLPLVKYNAERIHTKLPDEVDVEDLMSAGIFGLMDAINAFDMERGVKFETYCAPRIRGAILDELRAMDWVPRLVRSRTSTVNHARESFLMEYGRKPTDEELREKIGVDTEEYAKIRKDAGATQTVSITRKWYETDSNKDVREIDVLKDTRQVNPLTAVQKRDLKDLITRGLSRAERLIIILYYYEEMTMKEIGVTLDLSESRVSQMHSSILARLKAQLQHRNKELSETTRSA
ncbi:MAG: FliA/WhiG family RNA polymerase sigma factor [Phycisphaerales bacterium JB063]